MELNRGNEPVRKLKRLRNSLFMILTAVIFFGLLETASRHFNLSEKVRFMLQIHWVDRAVMEPYNEEDPRLMWSPVPNYNKGLIQINSDGYRDRLYKQKKPPKVFRIVCLGDSSTFGWDVALSDTYHSRLEQKLNHQRSGSDYKYEVINFGVTGYSSYQGLLQYKYKGEKFQPDVVTAYYGANDMNRNYHYSDREIISRGDSRVIQNIQKYFFHKMEFYKLLRVGLLAFRERSLERMPRVSKREFGENLLALYNQCKKNNIELVLIPQASCLGLSIDNLPINLAWEYQFQHYAAYRSVLNQVANSNSIPVVSIPSMLETEDNSEGLFLDFVHPSPKGHERIAQALFTCLEENRLLPD